jgi:O-antigen/teichoic acid export membrane protein
MLILSKYASNVQIGQYAAAWNITFIIDLMTHSVIIALLPRASSLITQLEFARYMKHTFSICLAIALMLSPIYFLSELLFDLFFPAYYESAEVFQILFLGAIITLLLHPLYLILYARNNVNRLTLINFLLVIFSLGLGLSFIPDYGSHGAAWVTVAGRLFASVLILYFAIRELKTMLSDAPIKSIPKNVD